MECIRRGGDRILPCSEVLRDATNLRMGAVEDLPPSLLLLLLVVETFLDAGEAAGEEENILFLLAGVGVCEEEDDVDALFGLGVGLHMGASLSFAISNKRCLLQVLDMWNAI